MKLALVHVALLASFASFAGAQLSPLPPSSSQDGILLQRASGNPSQAEWAASDLADYSCRIDLGHPFPGSADEYGRTWTSQAPDLSGVHANGGTLRVIFLGACKAPLAFGYAYETDPRITSSSFTVLAPKAGLTAKFGDHVDLPLAPSDAPATDFWLSGSQSWCNLLNPEIGSAPGNVVWTSEPLYVPTYLPAQGTFELVETWIASVQLPAAEGSTPVTYRVALQRYVNSGWGAPY